MNKAFKYRLYPTVKQKTLFNKTFGCCRKIWNLMLEDKIKTYEATKSFGNQTPAMYKVDYPFLKEVDSLALTNVQLNLQAAFKSCFDKKRKKCNHFPNYKSAKRSWKSYTTNNQKGSVSIIDEEHIKIPKIGVIKAVIHRMPPKKWMIKSATISQESDGNYYISVLFEYQMEIAQIPISDNAIGLDYASNGLFTDHNGNKGSHHKYYKESQSKLAKEQRKLSRMVGFKKCEKKSKNYLKQLRKINKLHRHISNQRSDTLHKLSTEIANRYDVVCVEDLDMSALSNKGFHNGKATMDNGYGMFCRMLEYKLSDRGKYFIKIDKFFPSSQMCSQCRSIHKEMKDLRKRKMECSCGLSIDRDQNAAVNILNEGLRILNAT